MESSSEAAEAGVVIAAVHMARSLRDRTLSDLAFSPGRLFDSPFTGNRNSRRRSGGSTVGCCDN